MKCYNLLHTFRQNFETISSNLIEGKENRKETTIFHWNQLTRTSSKSVSDLFASSAFSSLSFPIFWPIYLFLFNSPRPHTLFSIFPLTCRKQHSNRMFGVLAVNSSKKMSLIYIGSDLSSSNFSLFFLFINIKDIPFYRLLYSYFIVVLKFIEFYLIYLN